MPRVQFKATQGTTFTPLPKGTYEANIERIEMGNAKSSGNAQMRVILRVVGGEYDGREVSDWMPIGGENAVKSGWRIENLLSAAIPGEYDEVETGELNDKGKPVYAYEFDTDDLIGVNVTFKATIEEDQKGEERNQLRYIAKTASNDAAKAPARTAQAVPAAQTPAAAAAPAQAAPAPAEAPATSGRRARLQA